MIAGDLHDLRVGLAVHGFVSDGAADLDRFAGDLCLDPSVDVHADVSFGKVFAVQAAAGDAVGHIAAELTIDSSGVHIGSARPVAQRVDCGLREMPGEGLPADVALTDDEVRPIEDVS